MANREFHALSSACTLPWHNDAFLHPLKYSSDGFVLFGVSNPERTPTYAVELPAIVESLSEPAIVALKKYDYYVQHGDYVSEYFPVLSVYGVRYAQGLVKSCTHPDVLVELDSVPDELLAKGIGHEFILGPGDALHVEDKKVLHARGVISTDSEELPERHVVRVFEAGRY
jgi:hypothetical protein